MGSTSYGVGLGDWIVTRPEHWLFAGTGMKAGDRIAGLVGWEYHGPPYRADPSLEVVAAGPVSDSRGNRQADTHGAASTTAPSGSIVFNAGTCWWNMVLSTPPGFVTPPNRTSPGRSARPADHPQPAGPDHRRRPQPRRPTPRGPCDELAGRGAGGPTAGWTIASAPSAGSACRRRVSRALRLPRPAADRRARRVHRDHLQRRRHPAAARSDRAVPDAGARRVADLPRPCRSGSWWRRPTSTPATWRGPGRARSRTSPRRATTGAPLNTACGVTTQEYPFNAGQQITLGLLGAGHTAEQLMKGVYEGTLGRLVEWLFSTDTPEDRFAAETVARAGALRARRAVAAVPVRGAAAAAVGGDADVGPARHPQVGAPRRPERRVRRQGAVRVGGAADRRDAGRQGHRAPARLGRRRDAGRAAGQRRRDRVHRRARTRSSSRCRAATRSPAASSA